MSRGRRPRLGPVGAGAQRVQVVVPPGLAGERLDRAVAALVEPLSRSRARKVIAMGGVLVGTRRIKVASRKVAPGDHLTCTWHDDVLAPVAAGPLRVVHEDEDVVLVVKPAGQHSQGTELGDTGSLVHALTKQYGPDVRLVHRLDAPTSGVMMAGRSREAVTALAAQLRAHTVTRAYLVVTAGCPQADTCRQPLVRTKRRVRLAEPGEEGLAAHTDLRVLAHHPATGRAVVLAQLHTGRTHQVRVHLAGLGAPVVGDTKYGSQPAARLGLHAWLLGVAHPRTGEPLFARVDPGAAFWEVAAGPVDAAILDEAAAALGWKRKEPV